MNLEEKKPDVPVQLQPTVPVTPTPKAKAQKISEVLFDSGQTVIGIIIILLVALLAWEVAELMPKLDPNTQPGQVILTAIITGVIGLANAVVGFYFGSKKSG